MICPTHGKELKTGKFGPYCPTKVGDGWCKFKGHALPQEPYVQTPPRTPQDASGTVFTTQVDPEAKERQMTFQGALNAATSIYQGTGGPGQEAALQLAARIYEIFRAVKAGASPSSALNATTFNPDEELPEILR